MVGRESGEEVEEGKLGRGRSSWGGEEVKEEGEKGGGGVKEGRFARVSRRMRGDEGGGGEGGIQRAHESEREGK